MNNLYSDPIFITLEEFEKIISDCCCKELLITPVLQLWNDIVIGNYKATGYLIVSGVCKRDFLVVSYISEGVKQENIDYEKSKFLELINLSLVEPLVKKGIIEKDIAIADIVVK